MLYPAPPITVQEPPAELQRSQLVTYVVSAVALQVRFTIETGTLCSTVAWLSADGAGTVEGVAEASMTDPAGEAQAHVLGAVLFDGGVAETELLAVVQQHGGWMDWRAPAG